MSKLFFLHFTEPSLPSRNSILGMTSLLMDTALSIDQRDYVGTIQGSAEALLTIINDILDFSKIEAGKLTIEPIPFNLQIAVEEVIELLSQKAVEKDLQLLLQYNLETYHCLIGDPGRLRQV